MQPSFVSIEEWAKMSGLSRSTVYNRLGDGTFRAKKCGHRTLIDVEAAMATMRNLPAAKIGGARLLKKPPKQ